MNEPKKWTEIYPYGTKAGDDEAKFFRFLARSEHDYRSVGSILKATQLSHQRVEEIIDKYVNQVSPPLLYAHPTNDDHWAYWERCKCRLGGEKKNIDQKDKDRRIDKHLGLADMTSPMLCSVEDACSEFLVYDQELLELQDVAYLKKEVPTAASLLEDAIIIYQLSQTREWVLDL